LDTQNGIVVSVALIHICRITPGRIKEVN
jgi:hypothetical protein